MPPFPAFLRAKRERTKKENGQERILRYQKNKTREKYLNVAISGYCEIIYYNSTTQTARSKVY